MAYDAKTGLFHGYIYCVENSVNGKMYIGQTRNTIFKRFSEHKWDAIHRSDDGMALHRAIAKYGADKFTIHPLLEITSETVEDLVDKLNIAEREYVSEYNTITPHGYNVAPGGSALFPSTETPVYCFKKDGEFVAKYCSMAEAERVTGISHSMICEASDPTNPRRRSAGGFLWSITEEAPEYLAKGVRRKRKVAQCSMDGELIRIFDSGMDAANELNLQNTLISACCNGRRKATGGFRWIFIT